MAATTTTLTTIIYALTDPETDTVRAVGRTTQSLRHRLNNYLSKARTGQAGEIYDWIRDLIDADAKPGIIELDFDTEKAAIKHYGLDQLLNERDGGCSPPLRYIPTEDDLALLGTVSDGEAAEIIDVSPRTIERWRARYGIEAYGDYHAPIDWTPEMDALLGTDIDKAVAERLGLTKSSVFRRRHKLGIPAYNKR